MAEKNIDGKGVRVLLFGMPGSGKSSLLGALYQAAQVPESGLGKFSDVGGGLAGLHQSVYAHEPQPPSGDLTGYPVTLGPLNGELVEAVLIDTNGGLAEEQLSNHKAVEGRSAGARAIQSADALIFLVDPTKGKAYFDAEFQQFHQFVDNLEKVRGKRAEIAGLPIYLVLSKCDAIAPGQTGTWMQKIEEAKRMLDRKLQDNFAKNPRRADLPFGKTEVRVWATAVKKPAAQGGGKSHEPYGVAELFRECLCSAQEFYEQRQKAQNRLHLAVTGFLGLICVMAVAAGLFFLTRPGADVAELDSQIQTNVPAEHDDWFKEPLKDRLEKLDGIIKNPAFKKMPQEQQKLVESAKTEIGEYQKKSDLLFKGTLEPKFARSDEQLRAILERVETANPPEQYAEAWKKTKLVKRQQQLRQDVDNIKQAVAILDGWYRQQSLQGKKLDEQGKLSIIPKTAKPEERDRWRAQVDSFLTRELPLLNNRQDRVSIARFERTDKGAKAASPIFPELLNALGTQAIWINPKETGTLYWLMVRDFTDVSSTADLINWLRERRKSDKRFQAYLDNLLVGDEKADEKFERYLQNLGEYSLTVSSSPSVAYFGILNFQQLGEARKKLESQRIALKKTLDVAEPGN